jgi:hypothetical protein
MICCDECLEWYETLRLLCLSNENKCNIKIYGNRYHLSCIKIKKFSSMKNKSFVCSSCEELLSSGTTIGKSKIADKKRMNAVKDRRGEGIDAVKQSTEIFFFLPLTFFR